MWYRTQMLQLIWCSFPASATVGTTCHVGHSWSLSQERNSLQPTHVPPLSCDRKGLLQKRTKEPTKVSSFQPFRSQPFPSQTTSPRLGLFGAWVGDGASLQTESIRSIRSLMFVKGSAARSQMEFGMTSRAVIKAFCNELLLPTRIGIGLAWLDTCISAYVPGGLAAECFRHRRTWPDS